VKDIAAANETGDENRIAIIVTVFRRFVWITGLLGGVVMLILSPLLSQLTFGNNNYTVAFIWLSFTLLFSQLTSGQMVILQGMRKLQYLAKANLYGSSLGLLLTIPLYYKWGVDAIVPGIIIASLVSLLMSLIFSSHIKIKPVRVSKVRTIAEGKSMLLMGFMISLSGLIGMGASYLLRIFISNTGGVAQVGLYSAGFTIIGTYVGLVFTAMGTDYYPRLSGISHDNRKASIMINQQAEIAILILAPILCVFLVFVNWVIILLYSTKFVAVNGMIHWAALGMFFKAATWTIGFLFLAKGASKVFFWSELASNIYLLLFNIIGYYFYKLDGLGISFLISYIISFIQVFFIARLKYNFIFDKEFVKIIAFQLLIGITCFLIVKFMATPYSYFFGTIFIIFSIAFSIIELNKRIDLKQLLYSFKRN
jgi:O-antigen/teichoic acid export membrane protein